MHTLLCLKFPFLSHSARDGSEFCPTRINSSRTGILANSNLFELELINSIVRSLALFYFILYIFVIIFAKLCYILWFLSKINLF